MNTLITFITFLAAHGAVFQVQLLPHYPDKAGEPCSTIKENFTVFFNGEGKATLLSYTITCWDDTCDDQTITRHFKTMSFTQAVKIVKATETAYFISATMCEFEVDSEGFTNRMPALDPDEWRNIWH